MAPLTLILVLQTHKATKHVQSTLRTTTHSIQVHIHMQTHTCIHTHTHIYRHPLVRFGGIRVQVQDQDAGREGFHPIRCCYVIV